MADIERNVRINIVVNTKMAKKAFDETKRKVEEQQSALEILRDRNLSAGEAMRKSFGKAFQSATTFRNELLSLLFGSMSINMTIGALVGNIMNMMGASEAWQLIWMELLWDVVEPLADLLWWLVDVIEALPSPMKKVIGLSIVILAIIAQVAFFVAMIWQTLIMLFGKEGAGIFPLMKKMGDGVVEAFKRIRDSAIVKGVIDKLKSLKDIVKAIPAFLSKIGIVGGIALAIILYVLQYLLRYGGDLKKTFAMIVVDILQMIKLLAMAIAPIMDALVAPLRAIGINIPKANVGLVMDPLIADVKRWGGVEGDLSLLEQASEWGATTFNIFVEKLYGKDPETLMDEVNTAVNTNAGGQFSSVNVG